MFCDLLKLSFCWALGLLGWPHMAATHFQSRTWLSLTGSGEPWGLLFSLPVEVEGPPPHLLPFCPQGAFLAPSSCLLWFLVSWSQSLGVGVVTVGDHHPFWVSSPSSTLSLSSAFHEQQLIHMRWVVFLLPLAPILHSLGPPRIFAAT